MEIQLKQDEDLFFPIPFWFLTLCFFRFIFFFPIVFLKGYFYKYSAFNKEIIILGHRGSRGTSAENSMEGFNIGASSSDGFELDTQLCKSGEPIVLHDSTLDRTSNGKGKVSDVSISHLENFFLENGEKIPKLKDVIFQFADRCLINIEIKKEFTSFSTKILSYSISDLIQGKNKIIVSSFSPLALYYFRRKDKSTALAQLIANPKTSQLTGWIGWLLGTNFFAYANFVNSIVYEKTMVLENPHIIDKLHKRGMLVFVYTSNLQTEWEFFIQHKLDGIITDYPQKAKNYINLKSNSLA
jgi:glycerophosphoryl diester phosphodiesterase